MIQKNLVDVLKVSTYLPRSEGRLRNPQVCYRVRSGKRPSFLVCFSLKPTGGTERRFNSVSPHLTWASTWGACLRRCSVCRDEANRASPSLFQGSPPSVRRSILLLDSPAVLASEASWWPPFMGRIGNRRTGTLGDVDRFGFAGRLLGIVISRRVPSSRRWLPRRLSCSPSETSKSLR